VINNPYKEAMNYMSPKNALYFPACIASTRTYHEFVKRYLGNLYLYEPTPETNFGTRKEGHRYFIDDYRNPICAAIGIAYQFGVKKLMCVGSL